MHHLKYDKPIALIYNPNSGTKNNIRPTIAKRLTMEGIDHEFIATQKEFDTYLIANTLDLSKYSALIAVGGDGSASEVFGGMLTRKDGLKIPCGYIPNGSGGLMGLETGIYTVDDALDTRVARTCTKLGAIECLSDTEDATTVPEGLEGFKIRRFAFIGANVGTLFARMMGSAGPWKKWLGNAAYGFAM